MSEQPVEPKVEPVIGRYTIDDLRRRTCRWPYGTHPPYLYCGALTADEGCVYCLRHMQVAHPPRRR